MERVDRDREVDLPAVDLRRSGRRRGQVERVDLVRSVEGVDQVEEVNLVELVERLDPVDPRAPTESYGLLQTSGPARKRTSDKRT